MSLLRMEDSLVLRAATPIPVKEITDITAVADIAGNLAGKYFVLHTVHNTYVVWFRVDGVGVDPQIPGHRALMVEIAINATDTAVAVATQLVIDDNVELSATVLTNSITITNVVGGNVADTVDGDTLFSIITITSGVTPNDFVINCKFINREANGDVISVVSGAPDRVTYNIANGDFDIIDSNYTGSVTFKGDLTP